MLPDDNNVNDFIVIPDRNFRILLKMQINWKELGLNIMGFLTTGETHKTLIFFLFLWWNINSEQNSREA